VDNAFLRTLSSFCLIPDGDAQKEKWRKSMSLVTVASQMLHA
jgi:hypothetical protein